jgi:signal transduction histidine kinase
VSVAGNAVETIVSNPAGTHKPDPERMFDRFYRADPSRSAAAGGVGLGLAISRELTLAMNGKLWADFDGEGNLRLHLTLPAGIRPKTP